MNNEREQQWVAWGVALVVSVAVLAGLAFKGVSGRSLTDAVKDIGGALIPILAAFVAARLVSGQADPADQAQRAGEAALAALQRKHPDVLSGPKAHRVNYDPEQAVSPARYLFIQRRSQNQRAQFVPVSPFREGILEIRVPKTALLILGAKREGLEQLQQQILTTVRTGVLGALDQDRRVVYEIIEHKNPDIAVVVDFNEAELGPKRLGRVITGCVSAALRALVDAATSTQSLPS
ncbi:MAG: hypothetical protein FJX72_08105 [Armatimonadetes bacterium]|nr:hypothetical protein [Armatimonadota bacterium]